MGGAETEIGETTRTVLLEAANFEPYTIFRSSERHRLRSEARAAGRRASTRTLRRAAVDDRDATAARARRRDLERRQRRPRRRCPQRPVVPFRPEHARRGDRPRDSARPSVRAARGARLRARVARGRRSELARTRRHARGRRDRGGGALPSRRRALHAARAPRDVRHPHAASSSSGAAGSRTRSSGSASQRSTPPSLRPDGDTPWKLPEPISVELTALRTSLLPSLIEAARRNIDAGARRIALFEIARVYLPGGELPDERVRVAGIAEGGFLHIKGSSRRSTPR